MWYYSLRITLRLAGRRTMCTKSNRPRVLISNPNVPQNGIDILQKYCDLIIVENQTKEEVLSKVTNVDAIFWATRLRLDKDIIEAAGPKIKAVATMTAGFNHIDVEELNKRGIKFSYLVASNSKAVAEMAVLLALAASRRLYEGRLKIETNQVEVNYRWMLGEELDGSTVGIIGLGNIGQETLKRLKPFLVKEFLYNEPKESEAGKQLGAKFVSLDTLAKESDFVIVACPLNASTKGLCNADFFSKMKKLSVFVNVGRGEVVDQPALIKVLKEGRIFAAGLDVMTPEPLPPDHELLKFPNAIITPHLGSSTRKARFITAQLTANNILKALGKQEMVAAV